MRESEGLMDEARRVVEDALESCQTKHITDWGKIKNTVKDALSDFLWKRTKQKPHDSSDHYGGLIRPWMK